MRAANATFAGKKLYVAAGGLERVAGRVRFWSLGLVAMIALSAGCAAKPAETTDGPVSEAAASEGYYEVFIQSGVNACGVSITALGRLQHANVCAAALTYTYDTHLEKSYTWWNSYSLSPNVTGFWGETVFDSKQVFNKRMSVGWLALPKPKTGTDPTDIRNSVITFKDGESPVRIPVPIGHLLDITFDGQKICADYKCPLGTGHYASTMNNSAAEFAALIQQPYSDYLTVFHHAPLPPEFTALPKE